MSEGWESKQFISFILYLFFLGVSVWATGESIARSWNLYNVFPYLIGLAALLTASFCLSIIKTSVSPGYVEYKGIKAFIGVIAFVFCWLVSFTSNTHNFYYLMSIEEQRKLDFSVLINQMELGKENSSNAFENAINNYKSVINSEIINMKSEITNVGDPGHGIRTDSIIVRIEGLMGVTIDELDPRSNTRRDLNRYANEMARKIRDIRDEQIRGMYNIKSKLENFVSSEDFKSTYDIVKLYYSEIDDADIKDLNKVLRKGYSLYSKFYSYINELFKNPFLKSYSGLELKKLDEVPLSIQLRNISKSWEMFFKGRFNTSNFYLSLVYAIVIDLACFVLFYFGVLKEDE